MNCIIGGVERVINQVDTYVEYRGGASKVNHMSTGEILDASRADRLLKKESQKELMRNIHSVLNGAAEDVIITEPIFANDDLRDNHEDPHLLAKKAEESYARQAQLIASDFA